MTAVLAWPLVLDAHQLELMQAWQDGVETGDGPNLYLAALRGHQRIGTAHVPLESSRRPFAEVFAALGSWVADRRADALVVVWHDGHLHGALGLDCPRPTRLVALRADPYGVVADYYPTVICGAAPLVEVRWHTSESVREAQPALPVAMLELLAAWRGHARSSRRRSRQALADVRFDG